MYSLINIKDKLKELTNDIYYNPMIVFACNKADRNYHFQKIFIL